MSPERLRKLLLQVQANELSAEAAMDQLRTLPFEQVPEATVDHHRALRMGVPEVIYGEGKTAEQILRIAQNITEAGHNLLVTRLDPDKAAVLQEAYSDLDYVPMARVARRETETRQQRPCAPVAVVCAGTSDIPVAEEAVQTLQAVGLRATRIFDVGVAGIHRLFERMLELNQASVVIVIAGMEGALPSVVGGLVASPVIAVPTAIGYGAALGGFAALFGMLSSCASGLVVVNIGNGFGAAMAAHRMLPRAENAAAEPNTSE